MTSYDICIDILEWLHLYGKELPQLHMELILVDYTTQYIGD